MQNPRIFLRVVLNHLAPLIKDDETFIRLKWKLSDMQYPLNLENPKTFSEKLQWLKLNDRHPEYTQMVDKASAKDYVASIVGDKYIIPTYGIWDSIDEIEWDKLPEKFVVKSTGDSGGVVVCKNKAKLDIPAAVAKLKKCGTRNYYYQNREYPYRDVKHRFIAEALLENKSDTALFDYKFFCFDGEPKFLYVSDTKAHTLAFLNIDWTPAPFSRTDYIKMVVIPEKPSNLQEMIDIVRKLSKGRPHVRVDLYNVANHVYFGELTFFTCSGMIPFEPSDYDRIIGDMLTLPGENGGGNTVIVENGEIFIYPCVNPLDDIKDYKFFCFNGEPKYCQVIGERSKKMLIDFFDMDWNHMPFHEPMNTEFAPYPICKPKNFEEMKSVAKKLAADKPFSRIDLYNIDGTIYFGEITFFPTTGLGGFEPVEWDYKFGDLLELPKNSYRIV